MSRYASISLNGTKEQERCSLVEIKKEKRMQHGIVLNAKEGMMEGQI